MKFSKKILIYDFDGVICDSVNIKTEAFVELFKEYGRDVENKIKEYHLLNGGISRFKKIKYIENTILGNSISEDIIQLKANKFSELVKEKVIKSKYINGALEFIVKNSSNYKQFICTGTPENEILEILEQKNIKKYFNGIFGSPTSKQEIILKIISINRVEKKDCLFFGDAITDLIASEDCNIQFCGIKSEHTFFPDGVLVINDFFDSKLNNLY